MIKLRSKAQFLGNKKKKGDCEAQKGSFQIEKEGQVVFVFSIRNFFGDKKQNTPTTQTWACTT